MSTLNQIKVEDTLYDIEDTQARKDLLKRVEKVEGKGLSSNDFTNEERAKLKSLSNYDDTELREELGDKQDNLVSGQNIKTINGEDILGEGNIEIQGGSGGGVPTADDWVKIATVSFIKDDETIRHIISLDENGKEFSYDELLLIGSGNDGGGNLTIWFNTEERFTTDSGNINNFFAFGQTPTALIGRLLDKQYYILSQSQSLTRFTISSRFNTTKGKIQMIVLQRGVTTNKCNITVYGRNLNES